MRYAIPIVGLLLTAAAQGQTTTDSSVAVQQQVTELRQQLAQTKLALDKTLAELKAIREFLAQEHLEEQLAEWRKQKRELEDERRRVAAERRKLEQARQMLHRTTAQQAEQQVQATADQAAAEAERRKPRWSVQYMIGLIDKEDERIYLRVDNGRVRLRRFANIDTDNVMVRGTFVNTSAAPWRYTFVIRIAGDTTFTSLPTDPPRLNGQWRYQTPLLGPGDLHEFEVKVPVKNVYDIDTVQIGDVKADRPVTTTQTETP